MASRRKTEEPAPDRHRQARSPEEREHQMIGLAYDLAEVQMREGNASSQVVTHFLKLGTVREELERVRLEHEIKRMEAQTEQIAKGDRMEELLEEALTAFRSYQGAPPDEEFEHED